MSYSATVLADSPTAYWQMNETSGTTITDTVGGLVATAVNTPVIAYPSPVGTGVLIADTASYYQLASASTLKWALDESFCIEFIHRRAAVNGNVGGLIGCRTSLDVDSHFSVFYLSGNIDLDIHGSESRWVTGVAAQDTYWHHYVFNHVGSTGARELWIDGVLKASTSSVTKPTTATSTAGPLLIGNIGGQTPSLGGIDEVAIYKNATLSSARIQAHWLAVLNNNTQRFMVAAR